MINNTPQESNKFLEEFTKEILINSIKPKPAGEEKEIDRFPEIENLINNPEIQAIECPGPDRFLIIKTNKISPINLSLSEEEIEGIIKRLAEQAGIEVKDLFDINLNEIRISGLLSKHAGSRFLIIKSLN